VIVSPGMSGEMLRLSASICAASSTIEPEVKEPSTVSWSVKTARLMAALNAPIRVSPTANPRRRLRPCRI
jgi:hypothetical protein